MRVHLGKATVIENEHVSAHLQIGLGCGLLDPALGERLDFLSPELNDAFIVFKLGFILLEPLLVKLSFIKELLVLEKLELEFLVKRIRVLL